MDAFKPIAEVVRRGKGWLSSPFFFVNSNGKTKLKHYTVENLRRIWNRACGKTGECIQFYSGTKHSSASQLINEYGMNKFDSQLAMDCSSNTVNNYANVEVSTRKAILDKAFRKRVRKIE